MSCRCFSCCPAAGCALSLLKSTSHETTAVTHHSSRPSLRFEALCTGQRVADASSEFGLLLRTRIAQHRIFLGAEIDCFDPAVVNSSSSGGHAHQAAQPAVQQPGQQQHPQQQLPPLAAMLELKTYRKPSHPQQWRTVHRYKHPKWWLQSFLAGVPRLALGARDDKVRGFVDCGVGGEREGYAKQCRLHDNKRLVVCF